MTAIDGLEALRERTNAERAALDAFRADFELVHAAERLHGHCNEDEAKALRKEAGSVIQAHMGDPEWMAAAAAHYRAMAETIRRDRERSARIAVEVRAERKSMKRRAA